MEMLKKMETPEDDTTDISLLEQLDKLDLTRELSLDDLPKELQQDFKNALVDGRSASWIKIWSPFWLDLDQTYDKKEFPSILKLTGGKKPSDCLKYNLVDMMYSYAYVMRLYNGDLEMDAISVILSLCDTFHGKVYQSLGEVVDHILECSRKPNIFDSSDFSISILQDVDKILQNENFVFKSLEHLEIIFSRDVHRSKKCKFFQSWTNECLMFSNLSIKDEYDSRKDTMTQKLTKDIKLL